MRFKNLKWKPRRESLKRTISASGGLGSGDVPVRRLSLEGGWTQGGVPARTLSPEGGGLGGLTSTREDNECQRGRWTSKRVDYEISHRLGRRTKQNILYKGVEASPSRCILKTLRRSPKRKA